MLGGGLLALAGDLLVASSLPLPEQAARRIARRGTDTAGETIYRIIHWLPDRARIGNVLRSIWPPLPSRVIM
jgi:hypothetical protein